MIDPDNLDWEKQSGLLPAVVQDEATGEVRMLGFMNREALAATLESGFVTFFSRSKQRLWEKGETSGNGLEVIDIHADCDGDALLVIGRPHGPTCHLDRSSCFGRDIVPSAAFPMQLALAIRERESGDPTTSYTARLFAEGPKRIAQKVGEEGVETALAGAAGTSAELTSEAADLVYHLLVLLEARGSSWTEVLDKLRERQKASLATASS